MSEPRSTTPTTPEPGRPVPASPPEPPDAPERASAPLAPDSGQRIANPAAKKHAETPEKRGDRLARRQLLTGRAARLVFTPQSPSQLAWRRLRKNRLAVIGGGILILLYTMALLAPFLAPYHYGWQDTSAPAHPPMRVYFTPWPTVYGTKMVENEYRERFFPSDPSQPRPLRFFVKGEKYRLFWLIPADIHLFGTANGEPVHLLGTDDTGRDYLSRMLYAAQISLSVGLIGISITLVLGLLVGGASGYFGGLFDDITMRACEVIMSVPDFYLLLALAAALPPTLSPALKYVLIIAILSFVGWAGTARIIRGMVLSVREREYVEAARALGVSDFKIIVRHVLPSTFTYAIVAATLSIPGYILGEANLSFLNLGIKEPMASWGNMLSAAQQLVVLEHQPWCLAPGVLIFITTLAFNFLGDGLRDALDPKST